MEPTVFISYALDDELDREWVSLFSERLRENNVQVTLDKWALKFGDHLPEFMSNAIANNNFVLIVCTPRYKLRSESREGGVGYEGDIMTSELFTTRNHRKFIPILRKGNLKTGIPNWLAGKYAVDLTGEVYSESQFQDLLSTILSQKRIVEKKVEKKINKKENSKTISTVEQIGTEFEYTPVKIERIIIEDATLPLNDGTRGSALYLIPFQLNIKPTYPWIRLFEETWDNPPEFTMMYRPRIASVVGDRINLNGTSVEEVEKYHRRTLLLVIDQVNQTIMNQERDEYKKQQQEKSQVEVHLKKLVEVGKRITFD